MTEPPEMLDAIAADPGNDDAWHVLADWLLENSAPHAVLAAYDLQIDRGTRDPELIGDYAEARRDRHRLPALIAIAVDPITWRCGYVIQATVRCYERPPGVHEAELREELRGLFAEPAMQAMNRLIVGGGQFNVDPAVAIPAVIREAPSRVRRVSLRIGQLPGPAPAELPPWTYQHRPASATHLDLELGWLNVGQGLERAVDAGWETISLFGTHPMDQPNLERTIRRSPNVTFLLGGSDLFSEQARALDLPNVRWADPAVTCGLLERDGAIFPLDPAYGDRINIHNAVLTRDPLGWELVFPARHRLDHGDTFDNGPEGRRRHFRFVESRGLHDWYRAWLADGDFRA